MENMPCKCCAQKVLKSSSRISPAFQKKNVKETVKSVTYYRPPSSDWVNRKKQNINRILPNKWHSSCNSIHYPVESKNEEIENLQSTILDAEAKFENSLNRLTNSLRNIYT